VATTRSRPRGRETARPNTGGPVAEHLSKIYGVVIVGVISIIAFLTLTRTGHVIDLAVQHFMLFYAGVFALIALCASVGAGLIATDRMFLHPGQRVMMQSIHRAVSFGALMFLIIHIVTEILAQRVHVIDAFIPFLVPFRTFYIGLGTISSDLIILLVITGVLRRKFTGNGKSVWRWRAIHYTSYVAFVFGVWHGLLAGRGGKPYVDWSYGFVVAFVALGLAVRILANSLRPKEALSSPPVAESAASGSAPLRAAAIYARLGAARPSVPATVTMSATAPGALASAPRTGAPRAVTALPDAASYQQPTLVQGSAGPAAMPIYEPGYDGPPRYAGAPRNSGPMPRVPGASSGPMPRAATGPMPRPPAAPAGAPGAPSGGQRRPATGPMAATGAMPQPGGYPYGGSPGQLPWDAGLPETDPGLRYRMPGPGMPGYRAAGGDWRPGSGEPR
jgi:DMSO/TMAO reductase YedYZ heme-binding membrane subunit